jgi:hypothetical protein
MTTARTYKCNLCRDEITDSNPGRGVHFLGKHFEFRRVSDCENHICEKCIVAVLKGHATEAAP